MAHSHDRPGTPTAVKIVIPILIVLVVAGIWFFKNSDRAHEHTYHPDNPDFAVHVDSVDLGHLKEYGVPVLLVFGDDCQECAAMEADLEDLAREYEGKVIIKLIDAVKNPDVTQGYPVSILPTTFFYDANGNPWRREADPASSLAIPTLVRDDVLLYTYLPGEISRDMLLAILGEMGVEK